MADVREVPGPQDSGPGAGTDAATRGAGAPGVFLVSAGVLALEVVHVRIMAVVLWHHLTYMVVTVALLAFATAGTILALAPGAPTRSPARRLTLLSIAFAVTASGSLLLLGRLEHDVGGGAGALPLLVHLFLMYLLLGVPYLFGGLVIAAALTHAGKGVHRLYGANLAGSALGSAAFVFLVRPLGAPGLVFAVSAVGLVAAWTFSGRGLRRGAPLFALPVGLALAAAAGAFGNVALRPAPGKVMNLLVGEGKPGRLERTEWSPLARIDVVHENDNRKVVYQDGDAPTYLHRDVMKDPILPVRQAPYLLVSPRSALIIGAGGGSDVQWARRQGVPSVTAVEINRTTCDLVEHTYRDFVGPIYDGEACRLVCAEGRSFLNRSEERFDLIQLTGVDTYTALSSGAYVMSENYLYTQEAFREYLEHLNPEGILSILRYLFEPPREILRLFVMASRALREQGVADPGAHMAVVGHGSWALIFVRPTPLAAAQIDAVVAASKATSGARLLYVPGERPEIERRADVANPFTDYVAACRAGKEEEFLHAYPWRITPVTDDSPFFYQVHRWRDLLAPSRSLGGGEYEGARPIGHWVILALLAQTTVAGALLVLLPLVMFRRRGLAIASRARALVYFAGLGAGFIFAEIALMQKFVLYLGHPSYALSVILAALLLSSGVGSLAAARFRASRVLVTALPLIPAVLLVLLALFAPLVDLTLGLPLAARAGIAMLVIFPLGFVMGMPFPAGLRILGERSHAFVPWAFAVNGCASVTGSIVAILVAMELRFGVVLAAGAALYAVAYLARPREA